MPAQQQAALYLRSSKDRHDVSPDAQRRELTALAKSKSLSIVAEFSDVVLSGADETRPGFRAMLAEIQSRKARFRTLLVLDTARIARDPYLSAWIHRECEHAAIKIVYAKLPEGNPLIDAVILNVMRGFDQFHRLMSKEKGLAGMAENVRQGWRAGGRAPFGYRLEQIPTGAIRDGAPVTKSRLAPAAGGDADRIAAYLRGRATGAARAALARALDLDLAGSTLIGIEWNALTYAGATVWNVHNERQHGGGHKGGTKRRPRAEWVIQNNTHPALISAEEAEKVLARLESRSTRRARRADYLLNGLLATPAGVPWWGNGGFYRTGKRNIKATSVDQAVLGHVIADLQSDRFITAALRACKAAQAPAAAAGDYLTAERELRAVSSRIDKLTRLLSDTDETAPLLRTIEVLERERKEIEQKTEGLQQAAAASKQLSDITEIDVRRTLRALARDMAELPPGQIDNVKAFIAGMVDQIQLDPVNLTCRIHYRLTLETGVKVASPRRSDSNPTISVWTRARSARAA